MNLRGNPASRVPSANPKFSRGLLWVFPPAVKRHAVLQTLLSFILAAGTARAADQPTNSDQVVFDHPGGFYQTAFTLALAAPAGQGTIYYTTNGEEPLPVNRSRYLHPLEIAATTVVRAAAFRAGTNQISAGARTFLFVSNVLTQTGSLFPNTWGAHQGKRVPAWYGMAIANQDNGTAFQTVAAGLRSLPTLSIIANPPDLFSPDTGIYTHPQARGGDWERPIALEMFDADGRLAFRCGAGLRIHGGTSRQPEESPKHSFRLAFNPRHGSAPLHFPVFGTRGGQTFDRLVLRAGNNDSWLTSRGEDRRQADYLRDEWMRQTMLDLGHPSARGRFVHLYLNGLYWGVYDLCEQPGPALLGTEPITAASEFDVRKANKIEAGDDVAWNQMMRLVNTGARDDRWYADLSRSLDLPELADYLILNFYAGNSDWDRTANWFALRPRTPDGRFQFLVWDGECTLRNPEADTLDFDDDESPPRLFHALSANAEFRKLFATRARKLLFDGGPLAPEKAAERYRALADSVALALTAEAARWGNYRRDVQSYKTGPYESYTVEEFWRSETNRILTQYFPQRCEVLANQLRALGLFPDQVLSAH